MTRPHKFKKGPAVTDPVLVCTMILNGQFLYLQIFADGKDHSDSLMSPEEFENWTLKTIRRYVLDKRVYIAIPKKEPTA